MSTDQEPIAFPRGKRKPTASASSSTSTIAVPHRPSASEFSRPTKKKKDDERPSKRRAVAVNNNASVAASGDEKGSRRKGGGGDDFLFGNDDHDGVVVARDKTSTRGRVVVDRDDDDIDIDDRLRHAVVTSQLPLGGGGVLPPTVTPDGRRRIPPRIEALTFAKFARGTKVLGVVRELHDDYAVISLPTMLVGYVRREANGPPLTRVFPQSGGGYDGSTANHPVMAFAVLSATTEDGKDEKDGKRIAVRRRRIELSPWPVHVNDGAVVDSSGIVDSSTATTTGKTAIVVRGRIVSVEPHGCIVDLGSGTLRDGQRAFLKFDNVEGGYVIEDDEDDEDEDDDDDEEEDEGDGGGGHRDGRGVRGGDASVPIPTHSPAKRSLNPHRLYDFTVLPPSDESIQVPPRAGGRSAKKSNASSSSSSLSNVPPAVVQLGLPSPSTLASLRTSYRDMPSLTSLRPGMLTDVRLEAHARNGVCVSFGEGGVYRGKIGRAHV